MTVPPISDCRQLRSAGPADFGQIGTKVRKLSQGFCYPLSLKGLLPWWSLPNLTLT